MFEEPFTFSISLEKSVSFVEIDRRYITIPIIRSFCISNYQPNWHKNENQHHFKHFETSTDTIVLWSLNFCIERPKRISRVRVNHTIELDYQKKGRKKIKIVYYLSLIVKNIKKKKKNSGENIKRKKTYRIQKIF